MKSWEEVLLSEDASRTNLISKLEDAAGVDGYVISKRGDMGVNSEYTIRLRGAVSHGSTLNEAIDRAIKDDIAVREFLDKESEVEDEPTP